MRKAQGRNSKQLSLFCGAFVLLWGRPQPLYVRRTPSANRHMSSYYDPKHLEHFGDIGENASELSTKFFDYYGAVFEDGALTAREKALIALGVAHAVQCPYCIDAYTKSTLEKGCDPEQLTEAVHVATAIRGGASLVHGMQMKKIVDDLGM